MGTISDKLSPTLRRVVTSILDQWGSKVTIVRKRPEERAPDGSMVDKYLELDNGVDVPMFLHRMTTRRLTFRWGSMEGATTEAVVSDATVVKADDGIEVLSGDFAGQRFMVLRAEHEPRGGLFELALGKTAKTFPR